MQRLYVNPLWRPGQHNCIQRIAFCRKANVLSRIYIFLLVGVFAFDLGWSFAKGDPGPCLVDGLAVYLETLEDEPQTPRLNTLR